MKKTIFSFAIAAVAALMVSCGGKTDNNGKAADADQGYTFSVQNNITGTTGTANCHIPDLGAPMSFEVSGEGDILDVTATVKVKHRDKSELADEPRATTELWISGRQDDNKDTKITLTADEEMQKQIIEWLSKPADTELDIVFKGKVPKADLDKLNGKECTNTLVL
ncbi:MAG: hypothetical protein IKX33_05860 [Prevotella sp.]|nr:hypothetical protein [Prevotella sp.]